MPASTSPADFDDPVYKAAVVDLLAAVGYGEISAFERLVEDAGEAPSLADKVQMDAMATAQFLKVEPIHQYLAGLGIDMYEAMAPLREPIDAFHEHIAPADWYESLVKAYVGDGLANDFYREVAGYLDESTRDLVVSTLEDTGRAAFIAEHIRAGIAADHKLAGRLALWGRRVMGEAFIQAQRVSAERDAVAEMLTGGYLPGFDLVAVGEMIARIQARHVARMTELGLAH